MVILGAIILLKKGISKAQVFFYLDNCLKDSMFQINSAILLKWKGNEYHIVKKKVLLHYYNNSLLNSFWLILCVHLQQK